jgi:ketosteroid isomerase-like protein
MKVQEQDAKPARDGAGCLSIALRARMGNSWCRILNPTRMRRSTPVPPPFRRSTMARTMLLTLVLAVAGCVRVSATRSSGGGDRLARLAEVSREFSARYERGDAPGMAAIYTDDAVIFPPGRPAVAGRAAIEEYWRLSPGERIASHVVTSDSVVLEGATAYDWGTFRVRGERNGQPFSGGGKYVIVWREVSAGDWRMQLDMWNAGPPASAPLSATMGDTAASRTSERLAWLAGCWELRRPNGLRVEESWTSARGGMLLGTSRTTRPIAGTTRDTLVEFEQMYIREAGDTAIFTALPSGQTGASFRSDTLAAGLVSFFNPAHDFPQRVRYQRIGSDTVRAMVEGPGRAGGRRAIEFRYARVGCPRGGRQ